MNTNIVHINITYVNSPGTSEKRSNNIKALMFGAWLVYITFGSSTINEFESLFCFSCIFSVIIWVPFVLLSPSASLRSLSLVSSSSPWFGVAAYSTNYYIVKWFVCLLIFHPPSRFLYTHTISVLCCCFFYYSCCRCDPLSSFFIIPYLIMHQMILFLWRSISLWLLWVSSFATARMIDGVSLKQNSFELISQFPVVAFMVAFNGSINGSALGIIHQMDYVLWAWNWRLICWNW